MAIRGLAAAFIKKCCMSLLAARPTSIQPSAVYSRPERCHSIIQTNKDQTKDDDHNDKIPTMRFIQFMRKNDYRQRLGVVSWNGNCFVELSGGGCISNDLRRFIRQQISMEEVKRKICRSPWEPVTDNILLLPPVTHPEKIICIHPNCGGCGDGSDDDKESLGTKSHEPIFSNKLNNTLIGPLFSIVKPQFVKRLSHQLNLAVIIGKRAKNVPRKHAMDHVFGYCLAQDITALDGQTNANRRQCLLSTSMDTFCTLGPTVVHKSLISDVHNLDMQTFINGTLKFKSNTSKMTFRIDEIIEHLTRFMTLKEGDIILTGAPHCDTSKNTKFLEPGDLLESHIELLGRLKNCIVEER